MTTERRENLQRKIRGLLAKASDTTIPEPEQNTFREHARKLMEMYCIEYLDALPADDVVVEENFLPAPDLVIDRSLYPVLPHILLPIAKFFGCMVYCHTTTRGRIEVILGFKPNIEMVQYAANVVLRQGREEYRRLYRLHRSVTFGQSFWSGFAIGIELKFKPAEKSSERGIVLFDRTKQKLHELTNGQIRTSAIDISRPDMLKHGQETGEKVIMYKAVNDTKGGGFLE